MAHSPEFVERLARRKAAKIDKLAAHIREIDGNHAIATGALAEALIEKGWINVTQEFEDT